jgi:tetratricopeptide (TPR) repeat protein
VNALSTRDAAAPPRLADARSGHATDLAKSGWEAYQRGDVEKALADLTQAAAQPAAKAWVLYALGMSQVAMGSANDAIVSWERVRQAAPDFEPVYLDLADTYSQVGELTRSLAVLRDAEKRWPKSAAVRSAIGVIQVSRGALDEGITHLVEAAAAAPDDPLMHLNLGRAYYLRFHRGRRYVTSQRRWVAPEGDRQKASEAFQRCITLGGPYAQQARDALSVLEWSK